jgi:GAF domain-containing protein
MVVEDTTCDSRFAKNIFVTSEPYVRSYAGVRLIDGVGTLCVIGQEPRKFSDAEAMKLRILAKYVDIQLLARGPFQTAEAVRLTRRAG